MKPVAIQEGRADNRTFVYLLHVGDAKPNARYPKSTFDAIREACGPGPTIVVRSDDGTTGPMPVGDADGVERISRGEDWSVVVAGWSAGVRGIRRWLPYVKPVASPAGPWPRLAGIVAADGLHAPWSVPSGEGPALTLGPSEVFREYVEKARASWCPRCKNERSLHVEQGFSPECYVPCPDCENAAPFGFVLTHCMQTYMEAKNVSPRYLSTSTVARELSGWPCAGATDSVRQEGRFEVHSYAGPKVDYAGHVRQLREALPRALGRLRGMGVL